MDMTFLKIIVPMLISGLKVTFTIAIAGIFFGLIVGSFCGYLLQTEHKLAKTIAETYIWVIRATPIMVQALYVYFVIPKLLGVDWGATIIGIIVIALNSGAFISEIVKGALLGIDPGQKEAAACLGYTRFQTMVYVIVPQALKIALPAMFNQFIISVKDTALLSIITVNEMTHQVQNYVAMSFKVIPGYTALAICYLLVISLLIIVQKRIEKRLR